MRVQIIDTKEIVYAFDVFERYKDELFINGLNYYLYKPELKFCYEFFENKLYKIKDMPIFKLPGYTEEKQNEIVDTGKDFDNQTDEGQLYITNKIDSVELEIQLNDGHNRPAERIYKFDLGFQAIFMQNYKNNISWLLEHETVTQIQEV